MSRANTFGGTKVEAAGGFAKTPSVKIQNEDATNIGAFFEGQFLLAKEVPAKNGQGNVRFIEARIIDTDAAVTLADGKGAYAPHKWQKGEIVSLIAPSRLYRAVKSLDPGTVFYAEYQGMKKVPAGQGRKVMGHTFEVRQKPGSLKPEDVEYIKSRAPKVEPTIDAAAEAAVTEAEAEAAMRSLD